MNKRLRQVFTFSASVLMLLGINAEISSISIHGASLGLDQWASPWERRAGITKWGVNPRGANYNRAGVPTGVKYRAKTFRKGHHTYRVRDTFNTPGEIIGMDGNTHVSNYKVLHSLEGRYVKDYRIANTHPSRVFTRYHVAKRYRKQVRHARHRAKKRPRSNHRRVIYKSHRHTKSSLGGGMPSKLLGSSKDLNNPQWYVNHSFKIFNYYEPNDKLGKSNDAFTFGVSDTANYDFIRLVHNHFDAYKEGWIFSEAKLFNKNFGYDPSPYSADSKFYTPSKRAYSKALERFNKGIRKCRQRPNDMGVFMTEKESSYDESL